MFSSFARSNCALHHRPTPWPPAGSFNAFAIAMHAATSKQRSRHSIAEFDSEAPRAENAVASMDPWLTAVSVERILIPGIIRREFHDME
jgi:hypothetical protein